jgi:hypothetical protein
MLQRRAVALWQVPRPMHSNLVVLATAFSITGCTTHNRFSAGSTLNAESSTLGGAVSLAGATGDSDDGIMLASSVNAGIGHQMNGGSLLVGIEPMKTGTQFGGRMTLLAGPAFVGRAQGEIDATVEVRGSFSVFRMFDTTSNYREAYAKRTVGLELFVTNIGFDQSGTLVGLALSIGKLTKDDATGVMAKRRARSTRQLAGR